VILLDVEMAKRSAIEQWRGGSLRVFLRHGGEREELRTREFVLFRPGWALPTTALEKPYEFHDEVERGGIRIWPPGVPGLGGIQLKFGIRDGRFECIGIRSTEDAPPITSSLLRKLERHIRERTRLCFNIYRLIELDDGTIAAELPYPHRSDFPADADLDFERDVIEVDARTIYDETRPHRGKRPLSDDHLRRVTELYREAETLEEPRAEYIAQAFPNYERATIRNWIRYARRRDDPRTGEKFLGPAPARRQAGEKRKDKEDGKPSS